jgi:hypothetical protein
MRIFISTIALLFCSVAVVGQDKSVFHVTRIVTSEANDSCTGNCSAQRITVEGYTPTTQYLLDCVEILAGTPPDSPHYTVTCPRMHSGNDYDVTLFAAAISFGDVPHSTGIVSSYNIVSEMERKSAPCR